MLFANRLVAPYTQRTWQTKCVIVFSSVMNCNNTAGAPLTLQGGPKESTTAAGNQHSTQTVRRVSLETQLLLLSSLAVLGDSTSFLEHSLTILLSAGAVRRRMRTKAAVDRGQRGFVCACAV